jgi:hypothetical protein
MNIQNMYHNGYTHLKVMRGYILTRYEQAVQRKWRSVLGEQVFFLIIQLVS